MPFVKKEKEKEQGQEQDQFAPTKIVFEVLKNNKQSHKIVSNDTIICPETGKARKIRLAHGASTIYLDEMQSYEFDLPLVDLIFYDRKIEVDPQKEEMKLKYLRLTDQNIEKENRLPNKRPGVFKEIKPLADVKAKLAKLALQNKAESLATECSDEEMLPFAHVLGINIARSSEYVRADFIDVARIRPDYFLKYFDNPKNIRQYQVHLALNKTIIIVDGAVAKWKEGGKKIVEVPVNTDPKSFLADYAGTDEGKAFYEALKKLI